MSSTCAAARAACEGWLLDALARIVGGPLLGGMRAQLVAMAEFAIASLVLAEARPPADPWAGAVVARIAERYRQRPIVASLGQVPAAAIAHAWIVEALRVYRIPSPVSAGAVRDRLVAMAGLPGTVPEVMGALQARYLIARLDRAGRGGDPAAAPAGGAEPVWPRSPWTARDGAHYDLTHAVFFLSDLGQRGWPAGRELLEREAPRVSRELGLVARRSLAGAQHDLVGEVALALRWLDARAQVSDLLRALVAAQMPDGSIPGWPGARGIRGAYHATLVALMAFTVCGEP